MLNVGRYFRTYMLAEQKKDSSLTERDVGTVVHSLKLIELYAGGGTS